MSREHRTDQEWQVIQVYCPTCFVGRNDWCRERHNQDYIGLLHHARINLALEQAMQKSMNDE